MKPYYDEAGITIYHADCREMLPLLRADLVLTDPPYGIGVEYLSYEDTAENLDRIVAETFPLMEAAAPVIALTPGIVNIHRWPRPRWVLCWRQLNALTATGFWGFNEWQPVLVYGTDPFLSAGMGRRPDVIETSAGVDANARQMREWHPCPKPLQSWRKITARCSARETDLILDPFMGIGTTLHAAKGLGRRAIGIEIDERYCERAAMRLAQEVLDLSGAA